MSEQLSGDKSHRFPKHINPYIDSGEITIEFKEILSLIQTHKLFLLGLMLCGALIAWVYAARLPQLYESNILIKVEDTSNAARQSAIQGLGFSNLVSSQSKPAATEIALLKSRYTLQPVIESLGLNVIVEPKTFPIFGGALIKHHKGDGLAKSILGFKSYAWGGEKIDVQQFVVPPSYWGEKFKLIVGEKNTYQLYDKFDNFVLRGAVGQVVNSHTNNAALPGVRILISNLIANPGVTFYVQSRDVLSVANQLASNIKIVDLGAQEGSATGLLQVSLQSADALFLPIFLDKTVYFEMQNNVSKKNFEAQKTLKFLNQQSDLLKSELDKAETRLNNYRVKRGVLGVTILGKALLDQMVSANKEIEVIKLKKTELLQNLTEQHPYIIALDKEQQTLHAQLKQLENETSSLPKSEQAIVSLERDVRVKSQLYLTLLTKIQQLQITAAGTLSDVQVLADATIAVPIPSQTRLFILAGALSGLLAALAIVFLRHFIYSRGVEDPDYLEEHLGIPLFAVVPYSKRQATLFHEVKRRLTPLSKPMILADLASDDLAIESLRSLRTVLQLTLQNASNNIVAILGASPSIGKSFISLNLAYVLADSGKKILLIDTDLRRGKIHRYLGEASSPGLAEILLDKSTFASAKRTLHNGMLDFISAGEYPENPSELLFSEKLQKMLDKVAPQYDIVILDTPPVLAVSDGILVAKHAGTQLLLLGSASGGVQELEHAKKRLQKNNINIDGLIFNSYQRKQYSQHSQYGYTKYYSDKKNHK